MTDTPDDAHLDGCTIDFSEYAIDEEAGLLFPLFAEALDPDTDTTVEQRAAEWQELFG